MKKIIDLTMDTETGMPTCGTYWHQTVNIERLGKIDEVGRNTSKIVFGSHSGTHIDAPLHFIDDSYDIRGLNLNVLCGPVTVVDCTRFGRDSVVKLEDVQTLNITERMMFRFEWFKKWKTDEYYKGFPFFSEEAVKYLCENGMRLMALDTPSPDNGSAIKNIDAVDSPNHKYMLNRDVIIVEYLCNTDLIDLRKKYEIFALPLKLKDSDGSPSRVIVREVE